MDEENLFSGIKFIITQCNSSDEIKLLLTDGGAKHINYLSESVTHVIADENSPEAEEAVDLYDKPVVNSLWVYLSLRAKQLLPIAAFCPIKSIFQGLIVSFSPDLSADDLDKLCALLTFYGARVSKEISQASHFIAPSDQSREKAAIQSHVKVVTPDWVQESIRLNHRCDEQLFDPSLLLPPPPPSMPSQQTPTQTTQALPFAGCKFKMIEYHDVNPKIKKKWSEAIKCAGGIFLEDITTVTHLICETRMSDTYAQALKIGVRCITIYWINDILSKNQLSYPWKALHLPLPFAKNERPLGNEIISTTNFTGRERREVKEMILKTGARFTDYFSSSNTLLVCANVGGGKYERALEWKVPIANCDIISDILLGSKRKLKDLLTLSRYKLFYKSDHLKLGSYSEIREVMSSWKKGISITTNHNLSAVNGEPSKVSLSKNSGDDSGIVTGESNNSDNGALNGKQNLVEKSTVEKVGSVAENGILKEAQPSNVLKANDLNPPEDNEIKTKPEGIEQNDTGQSTIDTAVNKKSPSSTNVIQPESKRFRASTDQVRVMFTHLDSILVDKLKTQASALGVELATDFKNCTHLLADQICRTPKFICAFSHANFILSYKWIVDSYEAKHLLDERCYILQDKEGEERFSFNLIYSLLKRKRRSGLLFNNHVFFVTPSVMPGLTIIKQMIESAGGVVATRKPPSLVQIQRLESEGKRFIVVTCKEDYHLCRSMKSHGVDIVSDEFVISGILRQDIDVEAHRLLTQELNPPKRLRLESGN